MTRGTASPLGPGSAPASPLGPGSASAALRAEEVKRTRELLRLGWVVALGVAIALVITPGDRRLALALGIATAIGVAGSVCMDRRLRDPGRYDRLWMNALALVALACGQLGILYVGVFSAAPLMVALGLYFFCRTEHAASAIGIYVVAAGSHGLTAVLVISGIVEDPGFYPVGRRSPVEAQIAGQLLVQLAYALVFWLARLTRRSSLRAIESLQQATRLAAARDVQLAELRRDLDRALDIGGPGRFTGHVFGAWRLGAVLGRGAMGEVYEASHTTSGAEAAVKLLRRELLGDPNHVERFFREVRVASAIDSPHVVRVLEASTPSDALPFLAMERLRGQTLGDLLRHGRTLTGPALTELVTQVGSVLELARAASIVHRDLKPHNLFRTEAGVWKVLDFGVAVLSDSSGTLTRGGVIGTPSYMSPEQARGEPVDPRADVYALAAVIYRCLTGRAPFSSRDTPALLYAVVHVMPLRPSALAEMPAAMDALLRVALAKSRDARIATAAELVAAFAAAQHDQLPEALERAAARCPPWTEIVEG
ncbi:MAG: serine/threonine-protein kinase [Kofleriaceae bacterium]